MTVLMQNYFTPALAAAAGSISLRALAALFLVKGPISVSAKTSSGTADWASLPKLARPRAAVPRMLSAGSRRDAVKAGTVRSGFEWMDPRVQTAAVRMR